MAQLTLEEKLASARAKADAARAERKAARAEASRLKPHTRSPASGPRPQCIALNRVNGKRCKRLVTKGRSKLCRTHFAMVKANPDLYGDLSGSSAEASAIAQPPTEGPARPEEGRGESATGHMPDPEPKDLVKRGVTTSVIRQHKSATALVVSAQAKAALAKLGQPYDPTQQRQDPKEVLLALVSSAWLQQQVWAAMLESIPEGDWQWVGVTPVPGNQQTAKGTRIEAIQRNLDAATKTAARISKMAIDAGIEERLVRLAEEQQTLIADTVRAGLIAAMAGFVRQLHLTKDQEAAALDSALGAAANHLRRLASGAPPEVFEGVSTVIDKSKKTPYGRRRAAAEALGETYRSGDPMPTGPMPIKVVSQPDPPDPPDPPDSTDSTEGE